MKNHSLFYRENADVIRALRGQLIPIRGSDGARGLDPEMCI